MVEPGTFRKSFTSRIKSLENTMGMFTLYVVFKKNSIPYVRHNFHHFNQENVWVASDYNQSRWPQNYLMMHTATSGAENFAESCSIITYMDFSELGKWEHTFTGNRGDDYLDFKEEKAYQLLDAVEKQFPGSKPYSGFLYLYPAYLARLYRHQGRFSLWNSQRLQPSA
jgi:all-trans-retinol 13,14-reductase